MLRQWCSYIATIQPAIWAYIYFILPLHSVHVPSITEHQRKATEHCHHRYLWQATEQMALPVLMKLCKLHTLWCKESLISALWHEATQWDKKENQTTCHLPAADAQANSRAKADIIYKLLFEGQIQVSSQWTDYLMSCESKPRYTNFLTAQLRANR